jgi:hypothetical protein
MKHKSEVVEGIYEGTHESNFLWKSVIQKLTVRQAYVFYYSLAYYEKNDIAAKLGILDLPDETMVHKCLMDALLKENNPKEVARIIGANAHKILIRDNDLLWIKAELRAALWLSYFITETQSESDKLLLSFLRSTSRVEFVNRLIQVLDIKGCSYRGDKSWLIKADMDNSVQNLTVNHTGVFNMYRGRYVSHRINDSKLNWLNKISEDEIDIIIERFEEERILVLSAIFVPITKRDKLEVIKASLDIQDYTHIINDINKSLTPYANQNVGRSSKLTNVLDEVENTQQNKRSFASLSANAIIDLLKKAQNSREYRKAISNTKKNRSLTLKKESHAILIELSDQLGATPKKVIEALIKSIDLKDKSELSKIDDSISGRRTNKIQVLTEQPIIHQTAIEVVDPRESEKIEDTTEATNALKKQTSNKADTRKNEASNWSIKREHLTSRRGSKKH